jgi:hypothetical protein
MEKYADNCRLILCCESLSKLIEPLRSRCLAIRVAAPEVPQVSIIAFLRQSRRVKGYYSCIYAPGCVHPLLGTCGSMMRVCVLSQICAILQTVASKERLDLPEGTCGLVSGYGLDCEPSCAPFQHPSACLLCPHMSLLQHLPRKSPRRPIAICVERYSCWRHRVWSNTHSRTRKMYLSPIGNALSMTWLRAYSNNKIPNGTYIRAGLMTEGMRQIEENETTN